LGCKVGAEAITQRGNLLEFNEIAVEVSPFVEVEMTPPAMASKLKKIH
jgi:hypothetical protein